MKSWKNYTREERTMVIIIGVLLLAILLSFGRISNGWKKGVEFFYSSPESEMKQDVQLRQGPGADSLVNSNK